MRNDQITSALRQALEEFEEVRFAYLFGGAARDPVRRPRDLDVAVSLAGCDRPAMKRELLDRLIEATKFERVDLVVLEGAPLILRFVVVRDGIVLKGDDAEERIAFHSRTLSEYWDFAPRLKVYEVEMARRIAEGRFGA